MTKPHSQPPALLTIPQIAERLQVSSKTIRRWIAAGDLPTVRLGRQLRVQPQDLDLFLRQRWTC
ncbi:helix-turn-helix domain-containing protein [Azospirillum soli]|uniref:helix-turn-helix domain-containing protein n=1 Tax=Azospirillum soli TaxID=1304799 RepID=UPI001AEA243F|nr:helix-turn-helix domain-containing protein [Azospirillum soli]MBP2316530.1 excisionase family DNA binding protein [Azospirillum soli]